jgi:DNA invertase Pin-like site-specific DNA recombinase/uncharacterized Zn finger protein (UPF0148 family)
MTTELNQPQTHLVRCATYGRFSTKMQKMATLENQERTCRELAATKGWQVLEEHIYSDAAASGTSKFKRPGFQTLETAAEVRPRLFEYVVVDDTSRVARDQVDILSFVRNMNHNGIKVHFVSQQLDSGDQSFEMLLSFYSLMDADSVKRTSKKVWESLKGRALKGFVPGSWPYGYRPKEVMETQYLHGQSHPSKVGTWLEKDSHEEKIINRIFEMFANGRSMWSICILLNEEGIASPRSVRSGENKAKWSRDAVKRILHNQKYRGVLTWNASEQREHPRTGKIRKEVKPVHEHVIVDAPHLRIVTDELWGLVEERLADLQVDHQARLLGGYNRAKNKTYLYSGLLFCGVCKHRMRIGGKGRNAVYECPDHRYKRGCSNALRIRQDRASTQITEFIALQLKKPEYLGDLVGAVHEELREIWKHQAKEATAEALADLERSSRECAHEINTTERLISATGTTLMLDRLNALNQEREKIKNKIRALKSAASKKVSRQELELIVQANVRSLLEVLTGDAEVARQVLHRHIKSLYLHPSETSEGAVFLVTAELDLFTGADNCDQNGVLLGCLGTQTPQQHTDSTYRFIFQVDPRFDCDCHLVEPFRKLLSKEPALETKARTPGAWARLLSEAIDKNSWSGRVPRSGAVGWCLNNHREILKKHLVAVTRVTNLHSTSPLYDLKLLEPHAGVQGGAGEAS